VTSSVGETAAQPLGHVATSIVLG